MAELIRPAAPPGIVDSQEAIARQTDTAIAEVERLFEQELAELAAEAKITQYLSVLASRRVRMKLRKL
jgi:uncharacterized protein DUF3562